MLVDSCACAGEARVRAGRGAHLRISLSLSLSYYYYYLAFHPPYRAIYYLYLIITIFWRKAHAIERIREEPRLAPAHRAIAALSDDISKRGKKKTNVPQPHTPKKKKSYVCQHRRTQTSPKSTGRAPCLAGGLPADACTAPPRGTGTGGASANAATGAFQQRKGARQLPARRTNASPAVLAASAVGSGFCETRSQHQAARPASAEACARRNADAVLARLSVRGSKCTTEDGVCQKACSVTERSNRSARATYQTSAAIDCSPQRESAMQCRPRSAFAARTAGKPRVSRATRRVCGGGGRPSPATRGRGLGGTMGALRVSRARP